MIFKQNFSFTDREEANKFARMMEDHGYVAIGIVKRVLFKPYDYEYVVSIWDYCKGN